MLLGAHESIKGGFDQAIVRGHLDGCEAIQIFTKAPAVWSSSPITEEQISRFREAVESAGSPVVAVHDSYLINPCSAKPSIREKSLRALSEEARRCDGLGIDLLVMHPGSPGTGGAEEEALEQVALAVRTVLDNTDRVRILFENTAGQGQSLGSSIEHLERLIAMTDRPERTGVCIDTCHAFAAGYPLNRREGAEQFFDELEKRIGLDAVRLFHLNDSKTPLGSRVDRHELIGRGHIGPGLFQGLVNDPRLARVPGVVETPIGKSETYAAEVSALKKMRRALRA